METTDKPVSPWWYLVGGAIVGYALGLLTGPAREEEEAEGSESLGSRVARRIPRKIKFAGALGAIKGAGGEAYRELKSKLERRRHLRGNGHASDA